MVCYTPVKMSDKATGSWSSRSCGQCIGCRLASSADWATRCVHESMMHDVSCFLTLTYSPECLPCPRSLDYDAVPAFMKRLRKAFGAGIRYYAGGEYGDDYGRPHYHLCVFGFYPDDAVYYKTAPCGERLYTSARLDRIWGQGFVVVGQVSFESAAYIARYCVDKVTGKQASSHYERVEPLTGEVYQALPERAWMSRRPGIGKGFLEVYGAQLAAHDGCVVDGRPRPLPRYYRDKLAAAGFDKKIDTQLFYHHTSDRRLLERLKVQEAKMRFLRKDL